jgi:hypothetical protein
MRLNDCAVLLRALSVWIVATAGALQVSTANQSISNPGIAGAKLESVSLDESGRIATVRIRNLSDTDITAFDLNPDDVRRKTSYGVRLFFPPQRFDIRDTERSG